MAALKRNLTNWLIRAFGVLAIAVAAVAGAAGPAYAHEDDDNEVVTYGANACVALADLPVPASAVCVKQKREIDDGVAETKSSYVASGASGTVEAIRQSFEAAFSRNGWTIVKAKQDVEDQEWKYTVVKAGRMVKVDVEPQEPYEGRGTDISVEAQ